VGDDPEFTGQFRYGVRQGTGKIGVTVTKITRKEG